MLNAARILIGIVVWLNGCTSNTSVFEYTPTQRRQYTQEADLVFEGSLKKIALITKETTANAMEKHPDLNFIATFVITRIEKGSFTPDTFRIAIHSPTLIFQVYPSEYSRGNRKKYRIYIQSSPRGGILIGKELIAATRR